MIHLDAQDLIPDRQSAYRKNYSTKPISYCFLMLFTVLLIGTELLRFSFSTSAPHSILSIIDGLWIVSPHAAGSLMMLWPGSHPISPNVPSVSASVLLSCALWSFATVNPRDLCWALLPSSPIRHRLSPLPSAITSNLASSLTTLEHPRPCSLMSASADHL
jgi:hypothetical protein